MDWPALYGLVITATGWRPEDIDGMSLCDVLGLLAYWSDNPPAHVILGARYLRREGRARPAQRREAPTGRLNDAAFDQLGAMLGPPKPMAPYAAAALQWAETMTKKTR